MVDKELEDHIETIENMLADIKINTGSMGKAFWRGVMQGIGSVIGAALVILVIGWVLNVVGVIPAFSHEVDMLRQTIQQANTRT